MNLSSKDFNRKVSTIKDLNSVWKKVKYLDPYTQIQYQYGPKNTIIIDDSPEKLVSFCFLFTFLIFLYENSSLMNVQFFWFSFEIVTSTF